MKLNYRKFGEGHPIIIAHGLYGSSDNWVSIAKDLAKNFEVFLIDQRNHGASPHSNSHTYQDLKEDLLEFMNDHRIEKATLLGHSMGGKTVMFFAAEYPERISNLLIADIAPKNYSKISNASIQSIDHKNIVSAMLNFKFDNFKSRSEIDQKLSENIQSERVRQFLLKNLKRDAEKIFSWKLNIKTISKFLPQIMDGMNKNDFTHGKGIRGFPVLFMRGANSNYITDDDTNLIRTIFPYAEITTIPNAGHWLHAEQPKLLVKTIEYFVLD
nr:alpha/beta fold hydrolase [uncultured Marinifilum sp.]